MSSTPKTLSAPMTAHLNLKHDKSKHKCLANQICALDKLRIEKHLQSKYPFGPAAHHNEAFKTALVSTKPFSNDTTTVDVTNAVVTYTMDVGVGANDDKYTLLIDTGSSNTFVGSDKTYKETSTSQNTGNTVRVTYGSGSFRGKQYLDRVALSPSLVINHQGIGVTTKEEAQGFDGVDGILGIGPVELTVGTVSDDQPVPTVTDNLYKQKLIPKNSIGISYVPTMGSGGDLSGELTFGGEDQSKFVDGISYFPITSTAPSGSYWGIDQTVSYGPAGSDPSSDSKDFTTILDNTAGILDTGTTLLYLASDAFAAYQKATGAKLDSTTGLLKVTSAQYEKLGSLYFTFGTTAKKTFELVPDAQIWPRELNTTIGGDADSIYLVAADSGSKSGSGLDFINGFVWLQRFYTVYDTENSQIGIASTQYTKATSNFGGSSAASKS
ncbi:hypothetical protein ACEPAF_1034 [Sanghuangporus sanghuang]